MTLIMCGIFCKKDHISIIQGVLNLFGLNHATS